MEWFNAIDLARFQFAFTIAFHIVFPAFSIGLASYLAVLEGLWLYTGRTVFRDTFVYWIRIFAVVFGMGVVSGLVMSYQFGTNWSVFSDRTGPILGPLLGYEVLTAFFLEAGFLGVMLFGMERVGRKLHYLATLMVAFGTLLSAFWILSANSWMQTPAGFTVNEHGQYVATSWLEVIFNPSFPYRFAHMVLAAYLTTSLIVGGVGAWHLLKDRGNPHARLMFSMAMWMATLVAPLQLVVGDLHGLNTLEHQPAKVAAMEGHFETRKGAPLILFGIPDQTAGRTKYAIELPGVASLILTHDPNGQVQGLEAWDRQDWPNVPLVFWSFRIMVALGLAMIGLGLWGLWLRVRRRLFDSPRLQRAALLMAPAGLIAVLAGWIVTEVGRQPYTIYGLMRTAESASPLDAPAVAGSLIVFVFVYFGVFGAGVFYLLRLMRRTPQPDSTGHQPPRSVSRVGEATP
jgi:cytochrome d ubiquinol oxidase subunit I